MNKTTIEWTHRPGTVGLTWNPIRARRKSDGKVGWACTHASTGCTHCYAESINKRFGTGLPFNVPSLADVEFFLDENILAQPLIFKQPATIFVGDMFDLFHEVMPQAMIAEVLRVAVKTPRHTFQFLTKRAERMRRLVNAAQDHWGLEFGPHMWFGVSVENQKYADERIPSLLQMRAAIRFLSVEPMLETIDLGALPSASGIGRYLDALSNSGVDPNALIPSKVDWVICGGESGFGAREFNLSWAESLLNQCKSHGTAFFMKQLGSNVHDGDPTFADERFRLKAHKGGDPAEWPEQLRVREFPA